ncbi:MAG: type II secretion system F family protein, partial [Ellagibacter isourolithinifaciens]|nr:type II secretion system F family protein [Ellagibacter isourolithinifaciens]
MEGIGFIATEESLLSLVLAAILIVGVGGSALTAVPICGVALASCVAAACAIYAKGSEDKRRERMREAVPDALRSMAVCFRSGQSLLQTMQQVGAATKGPVGVLFRRAAHLLETGGSTREALSVFQGRNSVPEL